MGKLLTRLRPWEMSKIDNTTQRPRKNGYVEGTYSDLLFTPSNLTTTTAFPIFGHGFKCFGGHIRRTFPHDDAVVQGGVVRGDGFRRIQGDQGDAPANDEEHLKAMGGGCVPQREA